MIRTSLRAGRSFRPTQPWIPQVTHIHHLQPSSSMMQTASCSEPDALRVLGQDSSSDRLRGFGASHPRAKPQPKAIKTDAVTGFAPRRSVLRKNRRPNESLRLSLKVFNNDTGATTVFMGGAGP